MDQILKFVIRKKRSYSYDSSHIKKNGEERWTTATITPVFNEEGGLSKIVTIYSDITAVKHAEAALQEKNEDITDSIRYAERIQSAIMPTDEEFNRLLPDAFILFKPKDIVSGDFYWMTQKKDRVLFCTADCTGHGVPGAFMSMINSSLLNEIVNDNGITKPSDIFYEVRKGLVKAMKQKGEMGEQKDGMDATLCALSGNGKGTQWTKLECAVANNPVLIIREGSQPVVDNGTELEPILQENGLSMYEIKADRQPVGYKTEEMTPYTHHEAKLEKGDTIYTFSDGYQDQFGGPKGRKFMIKRQKELLIGLYVKPMQEQRTILDQTIEEWKAHPGQPDGYSEQIDDILVIGVKV
jgi:serine phosphatase RsbU (regulator of sigma subunit)